MHTHIATHTATHTLQLGCAVLLILRSGTSTLLSSPFPISWLGARVPDHIVTSMGHRRLSAETVSLRGDVALTTASGKCLQGNGAKIGTCTATCTFATNENVYGPFEAGQC